ncbi:hypothetical protein MTR_6g034260 [Medicago truncatula]|uniref:Uncharacterized protein n=1 Tax=Medicago truncatula TaxID=3880 RepID=A0A072UIZ2_MEDTR|nr:hypothetical protein MTR_6g034260 [Medicago truncatula]
MTTLGDYGLDDNSITFEGLTLRDCARWSLLKELEGLIISKWTMVLLVDRFQNSHVEFSRRQANRVAHELA